MGLFSSLRNVTVTRLIMIFLTVNFMFLAAQVGLSNYYFQVSRNLNEEILNLTDKVTIQSQLEQEKIRLLVNNSIGTLIHKIDKTTAATAANLSRTQQQTDEVIANQQIILFRLSTLANNKTMSQTLDNVLEHQQAVIKLLLNRNQTK